ncbi:MAG: hypothetical protein ACYSSP_01575 [Planctomycetota bacterium]
MKESPESKKLEEVLRSSKLVAGGFMGRDSRSVSEVISSDAAELSRLGYSIEQIAKRMQEITDAATKALGNWVDIDEILRAVVEEAKGLLVCPWPHPGGYDKRITTVELRETGESIFWSDLNIHLIAEHGFFEGKGSAFRVEPKKLVDIIF